jgi:hypothetical protein
VRWWSGPLGGMTPSGSPCRRGAESRPKGHSGFNHLILFAEGTGPAPDPKDRSRPRLMSRFFFLSLPPSFLSLFALSLCVRRPCACTCASVAALAASALLVRHHPAHIVSDLRARRRVRTIASKKTLGSWGCLGGGARRTSRRCSWAPAFMSALRANLMAASETGCAHRALSQPGSAIAITQP